MANEKDKLLIASIFVIYCVRLVNLVSELNVDGLLAWSLLPQYVVLELLLCLIHVPYAPDIASLSFPMIQRNQPKLHPFNAS
jgi:hypothetical protein